MENKQTGITLIALVITIILLLILAGIAISSLMRKWIIWKSKNIEIEIRLCISKRKNRNKVNGSTNRLYR